jgi:hypothetical protein
MYYNWHNVNAEWKTYRRHEGNWIKLENLKDSIPCTAIKTGRSDYFFRGHLIIKAQDVNNKVVYRIRVKCGSKIANGLNFKVPKKYRGIPVNKITIKHKD